MFYVNSLSEVQAELIADAYYRSGKDPKKMAAHLGIASFDLDLIRHPLVKRQIAKLAMRMRASYTLEDHIEQLKQIRDQAMEDSNLRIALAAELSVGKAAGLYEKLGEPVAKEDEELKHLTTDQLRAQLNKLQGIGGHLPSPDPKPVVEQEEF